MLVNSKLQRHMTIGANHVHVSTDMTADQKRAALARSHNPVVLVPGANEVDSGDWAKVEGYSTLHHYIKSGDIVPLKVESLRDLKTDAAVETVKNCYSLALLDKWETAESRKPVLQALAAQKKSIVDQIAKAESETETRGAAAS